MRRRLPPALALLLVTGGCLFGAHDEAIPDPTTCTNSPSSAMIDEVAVGTAPGEWVALADGDGTYLAEDELGNDWVALRAAWRGEGAPACAQVRIALRDPVDDSEIDHFSGQLTSSPQTSTERWRVSDEVFFRAERLPETVIAVVEVYGAVVRRTVTVGGFSPPEVDAGER